MGLGRQCGASVPYQRNLEPERFIRKQCIQWAIMIADGMAGTHGPAAWAQPIEEES